jgi:hypothetical protein
LGLKVRNQDCCVFRPTITVIVFSFRRRSAKSPRHFAPQSVD